MLLSNEDLESLPADPDLALAQYARIALDIVDDAARDDQDLRKEFLLDFFGFLDAYQIELGINREIPDQPSAFAIYYKDIHAHLLYQISAIAYKQHRDKQLGVVTVVNLDADFRSEIIENLTNIKKIVHKEKLSDKKRTLYSNI